jgi:hypothetical protein
MIHSGWDFVAIFDPDQRAAWHPYYVIHQPRLASLGLNNGFLKQRSLTMSEAAISAARRTR